MEKMQESINKHLEELKNKHTNNIIIEIKNTLEDLKQKNGSVIWKIKW